MALKLKLDDAGNAVLKDGKPVYVKDDNTEIEFDADQAFTKIGQLTGQSTDYRKRMEVAEGHVKLFEGIDDAEAARKALNTVKNLDEKKLIDAGQVEKVKQEAITATELKYKPYVDMSSQLQDKLNRQMIGGAFSASKYIPSKLAIPADFVQARFGSRFKVEGDAIVAYDAKGEKIFSPKRPGELADVDEALEIFVEGYADKASILKGTGASGGGAGNGTQSHGGGNGSKKVYTRAQFNTMDAATQRAISLEAGQGKAEIRDA